MTWNKIGLSLGDRIFITFTNNILIIGMSHGTFVGQLIDLTVDTQKNESVISQNLLHVPNFLGSDNIKGS